MTRVESAEHVTPQVKWFRRGRRHGSEVVKSHDARHDHEGIELGLIDDLKALRAEMSCGEVRAEIKTILELKRSKRSIKKMRNLIIFLLCIL